MNINEMQEYNKMLGYAFEVDSEGNFHNLPERPNNLPDVAERALLQTAGYLRKAVTELNEQIHTGTPLNADFLNQIKNQYGEKISIILTRLIPDSFESRSHNHNLRMLRLLQQIMDAKSNEELTQLTQEINTQLYLAKDLYERQPKMDSSISVPDHPINFFCNSRHTSLNQQGYLFNPGTDVLENTLLDLTPWSELFEGAVTGDDPYSGEGTIIWQDRALKESDIAIGISQLRTRDEPDQQLNHDMVNARTVTEKLQAMKDYLQRTVSSLDIEQLKDTWGEEKAQLILKRYQDVGAAIQYLEEKQQESILH